MKTRQSTKNPPEHKCAICPYSTKIRTKYNRHIAVHSNVKPFKCPDAGCPYRAKWKESVTNHFKNVHMFQSPSARPFPCAHPGCNYRAKQKYKLATHSKIHTEKKSLFCSHPDCNYSTNQKQNLTVHSRNHTGEKAFVCQFESCSYAAATSSHLVTHTRTHTKEKPYKCPEAHCKFSASHRYTIKQHQLTHETKDGQRRPSFSCPLCEYSAKTTKNLSSHIKTHTLEKTFKCDKPNCKFEAQRKWDLKKHKVHVHCDEKPFACSVESCESRFKSKGNLSKHLKLHSDERRYKCELCPFRAKTKKTVTTHIQNIHSDPDHRPFKCKETKCDFKSKTKGSLNMHILIHKGEKKYSCSFPDCDYRAILQYMLRRHQERMHEPEKRLKCSLCHFAAKGKATLVQHMRTHTKEEPYVCNEEGCGYRAKTSSSLRKHEKKNHL